MVVRVEWVDSEETQGWTEVAEAETESLGVIVTVGHLLSSDDGRMVLAHSLGGKEALGVLTIPLGCVKRVTNLTESPA